MSIEKIEGIGPSNAQKLAKAGIRGVVGLLNKGATPAGRKVISEKSGISTATVLQFVNMADLFRIKGVSTQYAELLKRSGVDTVVELAQRNPDNLHQKMLEINAAKKFVRAVPSLSMVQRWVQQAKSMPRVISY